MPEIYTPTKPLRAQDPNKVHQQAQKRKTPKASHLCKTPPTLIRDDRGQSFQRGVCIGQGGFARCFQVNAGDGKLYAAKTIAKSSLQTGKTREKLLEEIKIHKSMDHPNIVQFIDCFEDTTNVYLLLEICSNRSMMDLMHHRRSLCEVEARYYLVQILGAVHYMHTRLVLHRDIKLGNIFIDSKMRLKIGDFGLAATLEGHGHTRKTICGTPNYLAPEVISGPHKYSFPTDMWAVGIILYAMLYGKPPFQERDVNVIYKRIQANDLKFRDDIQVSRPAKNLITKLLDPSPFLRPSVLQILSSDWFPGDFTANLPVSALDEEPEFSLTMDDSVLNFMTLKIACGLELTPERCQVPVEPVTKAEISDNNIKVLPDTISPASTKNKYHMVYVKDDPQTGLTPLRGYESPIIAQRLKQGFDFNMPLKATRTSTEYGPLRGTGIAPMQPLTGLNTEPASMLSRHPSSAATAAASRAMETGLSGKRTLSPPTPGFSGLGRYQGKHPHFRSLQPSQPPAITTRRVAETVEDSLRTIYNTMGRTILAYKRGTLEPNTETPGFVPSRVTKWADFSEACGLTYGLSDGSAGIVFNDGTFMRMDPIHLSYMYYESGLNGSTTARRVSKTSCSTSLRQKLCKFDEYNNYMNKHLNNSEPERGGADISDGIFVYKHRKGSSYMMFIFSDGGLQFNFHDHYKFVLFDKGQYLHIIEGSRPFKTLTFEEAVLKADLWPQVGLKNKLESMARAVRGCLSK